MLITPIKNSKSTEQKDQCKKELKQLQVKNRTIVRQSEKGKLVDCYA